MEELLLRLAPEKAYLSDMDTFCCGVSYRGTTLVQTPMEVSRCPFQGHARNGCVRESMGVFNREESFTGVLREGFHCREVYTYTHNAYAMPHILLDCRTQRTDHVIPVRRFFEAVFGADLRSFFAQTCFQLILTHGDNVPLFCQQHYLQGLFLYVILKKTFCVVLVLLTVTAICWKKSSTVLHLVRILVYKCLHCCTLADNVFFLCSEDVFLMMGHGCRLYHGKSTL